MIPFPFVVPIVVAPMDSVFWLSVSGFQLVPPLVVF
jgi:hypothetical protein